MRSGAPVVADCIGETFLRRAEPSSVWTRATSDEPRLLSAARQRALSDRRQRITNPLPVRRPRSGVETVAHELSAAQKKRATGLESVALLRTRKTRGKVHPVGGCPCFVFLGAVSVAGQHSKRHRWKSNPRWRICNPPGHFAVFLAGTRLNIMTTPARPRSSS